MAELGNFLTSSEDNYGHIDVEMLDYDFVKNCTDTKKLRGILQLLQSGKEGYYPEVCYIHNIVLYI
jgi:hypothetical protein